MTKKMECGCTIEWPHQNNHAEQGVARRQHRETCALYAAIHQLRKARENVKMIESNIAYLRRVKEAGGEAAYTRRQIRILDAMAEEEQLIAREDGFFLTHDAAVEQVYLSGRI